MAGLALSVFMVLTSVKITISAADFIKAAPRTCLSSSHWWWVVLWKLRVFCSRPFIWIFPLRCQSSNEARHLLFLIPRYCEALLIGCSVFIVFVKKGKKGGRVGKRKRSGCIRERNESKKSRRKVRENKKKIWNCWQFKFSLIQKVV